MMKEDFSLNCPVPIAEHENILLAHGGGGSLTHQLIEKYFAPFFKNPNLETKHDSAVFDLDGVKVAFTTDSYVVSPLFFPGGDIGSLAVNGTVNDLAMCGARPMFLSAGFIIEEGLPTKTLAKVAESMAKAASECKVALVTGDTKVVDKGKGDGLFINTAGIGIVKKEGVHPTSIRAGDFILLNSDIGRHGIAIMAQREGLSFESEIESDSAALNTLVLDLIGAGVDLHCMRDLTRGGLAGALVEIAKTAKKRIVIDEKNILIREDVRGACELLGLDALYVANEGRFVSFVPEKDLKTALETMHKNPLGRDASVIGRVEEKEGGLAVLRSPLGAKRILSLLSGEQLPRIC